MEPRAFPTVRTASVAAGVARARKRGSPSPASEYTIPPITLPTRCSLSSRPGWSQLDTEASEPLQTRRSRLNGICVILNTLGTLLGEEEKFEAIVVVARAGDLIFAIVVAATAMPASAAVCHRRRRHPRGRCRHHRPRGNGAPARLRARARFVRG